MVAFGLLPPLSSIHIEKCGVVKGTQKASELQGRWWFFMSRCPRRSRSCSLPGGHEGCTPLVALRMSAHYRRGVGIEHGLGRAHLLKVERLEEAVAAARNTRVNRRVLHQYENLERANYRFVEHDAAHRPEEARITEGEDATVRRHGPVATSVFGALDGFHRFVELLTAH